MISTRSIRTRHFHFCYHHHYSLKGGEGYQAMPGRSAAGRGLVTPLCEFFGPISRFAREFGPIRRSVLQFFWRTDLQIGPTLRSAVLGRTLFIGGRTSGMIDTIFWPVCGLPRPNAKHLQKKKIGKHPAPGGSAKTRTELPIEIKKKANQQTKAKSHAVVATRQLPLVQYLVSTLSRLQTVH